MTIDLSDLNKYFQSESKECLPTGTYRATLTNAVITLSKNGNRLIQWTLEAVKPSGRIGETTKFSPLIPQSMSFLQADLAALGISLTDLNELFTILPTLKDTIVDIQVEDDASIGLHTVTFVKKVSQE